MLQEAIALFKIIWKKTGINSSKRNLLANIENISPDIDWNKYIKSAPVHYENSIPSEQGAWWTGNRINLKEGEE